MKATIFALAASMAAGVSAAGHARRHAHEAFHNEARHLTTGPAAESTCGCTTYYTTITGAGVLVPAPTKAVVPTPAVTTIHEPGTYTVPATTITLTSSTTVCAAASTHVPPGEHTYGGVTTIVQTSTTIVCPIATVTTKDGIVTSHLTTTTYVCPTPGTYTIAPETTSVSASTILVYPTPATYAPGTYTHDAIVTTITKTDYVLFCPLTSSQAPEPTQAPAPVEEKKPEVKVAEAPKPVETPKESAPAGKLGSGDDQWAMTYTPYTSDPEGLCKEPAEIRSDLAKIAGMGFKAIRVYSPDCSALEHIPGAAKDVGLQLILGVFIDGSGIAGAQKQVDALNAWKGWKQVILVVVGNEALFNTPPRCSPGELAAFITSAKASFRASGYSGPVTTAEPLNIWQANAGALCDAVDVLGFNNHPFFNGDVEASQAGKFAKGQLEIASALCPGKSAVVLEIGWPSDAYSCNGKACAGVAEQSAAIGSIVKEIGGSSVIFSYTNDEWKQPGAFGAEQHWGCSQLF